jgi:hypothetical protein
MSGDGFTSAKIFLPDNGARFQARELKLGKTRDEIKSDSSRSFAEK